ncbi:proteasome subunit beta type-6-like [Teleopsis dalmanni]|uniref:proteasome subunit beta type-6-like n=1 Tax=Teleopsis dalmanni TaxID=139649 RepID=UPI0018CE0DC3|nr:proteasome subunit beta type-6-like [Teleopsis dalmanni]
MAVSNETICAPINTGTTIMAIEFNCGVIIAADSRTSGGQYVANRVTDKLTCISNKIYCCRSGAAADTQTVADLVQAMVYYESNSSNRDPLVYYAAMYFRNIIYHMQGELLAGIIVAGYDDTEGGQVYTISHVGMVMREPISVGGSGSTFILGFAKDRYHVGMKEDECVALAVSAIKLAQNFDGSSGGVVRIGIITASGIVRKIFYNTPEGEEISKVCIGEDWNYGF